MADTRRTLAALQTLLADNVGGDISAQDVRDFLVSVNAQNSVQSGTFAALPATCFVGDLYLFTDSVYPFARATALDTWSYFLDGKLVTPPGPKANWTNVNAGTDLVVTDAAGSIHLSITRNATLNLRGIAKAQPATPYTATAFVTAQQIIGNGQIAGLYFYDGTKLMGLEFVPQSDSSATVRVLRWTNVTTAGTTLVNLTGIVGATPAWGGVWLRLSNDGANLDWQWSLDGIVWTSAGGTEAVGTTLTPTHYFVGGVNAAGAAANTYKLSLQALTLG